MEVDYLEIYRNSANFDEFYEQATVAGGEDEEIRNMWYEITFKMEDHG